MQINGQAVQPGVMTDAQHTVAFDQPEDSDIFMVALDFIEDIAQKITALACRSKGPNFQTQASVAERLPDPLNGFARVPGHEDLGVVVLNSNPSGSVTSVFTCMSNSRMWLAARRRL